MKKILLTAFLIFFTVNIPQVKAENSRDVLFMKTGISGQYLYNTHSTDFTQLPGVHNVNDVVFQGGSAGGMCFGIFGEYLLDKNWGVNLSANYSIMNIELMENEIVGGYEIEGIFYQAASEYLINTELSLISLNPKIVYLPSGKGLNFKAGVNAGVFMKSDFQQYDRLGSEAQNNDMTLTNQAGEVLEHFIDTSGTIDDISPYIALTFGVGYYYQLSKEITVSPEISYQYNLTDIVSGLTWKIHSFSAGISVSYSLYKTPVTDEEKKEIERQKEEERLAKIREQETADSIAAIEEVRADDFEEDNNGLDEDELAKNIPTMDANRIYILFHTTKSEELANEIKGYLIGKGIQGIRTEVWENPKDPDDTRFRVISREYPDYMKAYKEKKRIKNIISELMKKYNVHEMPQIQIE